MGAGVGALAEVRRRCFEGFVCTQPYLPGVATSHVLPLASYWCIRATFGTSRLRLHDVSSGGGQAKKLGHGEGGSCKPTKVMTASAGQEGMQYMLGHAKKPMPEAIS